MSSVIKDGLCPGKDDRPHERGVCGWRKVCFVGKGKQTGIRGQVHESPRMNLSGVSHRYSTK